MIDEQHHRAQQQQLELEQQQKQRQQGVLTRLFAQQNLHNVPTGRLYKMTPEERVEGLQELHGAADAMAETAEFIRDKLEEFRAALADPPAFVLSSSPSDAMTDAISNHADYPRPKTNTAYELAVQQNPDYVQNLHLSFLRAEKFQIAKAYWRMMLHFETRWSLFHGNLEVLGRNIEIGDLPEESDVMALEMGLFELLFPYRDSSGRPILLVHPRLAGKEAFHLPSMIRLFFWMGCLAAQMDEEAQQKGLVVICCYDDRTLMELLNDMAMRVSSQHLVRMRTHYGNHLECQNSLMTYGIPRTILPISTKGVHCLDRQRAFLNRLRQKQNHQQQQNQQQQNEQQQNQHHHPAEKQYQNKEETTISSPGPMDVILGRGRRGIKSQGNAMMKKLLEQHFENYNSKLGVDKTAISQIVYQEMQEAGCRFLKPVYPQDKDYCDEKHTKQKQQPQPQMSRLGRTIPVAWVQVDEETALDRIGHGFRNMRQQLSSLNPSTK